MFASERLGYNPRILMLFGADGQRLDNPGIRFASFPKFLQGKAVVVVLVHLVEDFVDPFLGRVLVFGRLLTLQTFGMYIFYNF